MANIFDSYGMDYTASLNNALRDAKIVDNTEPIPDGKYQCRIVQVSIKPSKKYEDELQMDIALQIIEGIFENRFLHRYYAIIPEQMDRIKTDMHTLGIDLKDDIRNLGDEDLLNSLYGRIVDVQVKWKTSATNGKSYQNVYINRLVSMGSFEETDEDEPLPFD